MGSAGHSGPRQPLRKVSMNLIRKTPAPPKHMTDAALADEVIKAFFNLPTAKEAKDAAEHRCDSAWRDKIRVIGCSQGNRCEADACPYCQRRETLIEITEEARLTKLGSRTGARQRPSLSLTDADDAELADELLKVELGIPTRSEALRRAKNVFRQARRQGLNVGTQCEEDSPCGRFNCPACRRSQQLASIAAFLTACDIEQCWRTITIIPAYGRSELNKQPLGDLRKVTKRVIETLQEHAPRISGMFAMEASVNTDLRGVQNCQWHVHGIFQNVKEAEYRKIQKAFKCSDGSSRAVHSKKARDVVGYTAYMLKPEIFGRNTYMREDGRQGTGKYPVRTRQEAWIASGLGVRKIRKRVFFLNLKEVETLLADRFRLA